MSLRLASLSLLLMATGITVSAQALNPGSPVRVLVITGGHNHDEEAFADVFRSMKSISLSRAKLGGEAEAKLKPDEARNYDVLVFYDMYQKCAPYLDDLMSVLEQGKGVVFLHHALGSCAEISEYGYMVGGHGRFGHPAGSPLTPSKFKAGTSYRAHIEDPAHPITSGMKDFDVTDEVYSNIFVNSDVHLLLTTDNPISAHQLAWTWQYKKSPVVYIELGHDHVTYDNPNYRKLVERSILWVSGRLKAPAPVVRSVAGERLYARLNCAACHGNDARGARGPDLKSPALWARSDAEQHVVEVIKNGVKGTEMPPYAKIATDEEIRELVNFFSSATGSARVSIAGDAKRGREVYRSNCAKCHGPEGRGGLLGPELRAVVRSKGLSYLTHAVRQPGGEVPFSYEAVSVTTKDGRRITGVRRDEDNFSLQVVDQSGVLHLFQKDELRDVVHGDKPVMPAYDETRISQGSLLDTLAYLQQTSDN